MPASTAYSSIMWTSTARSAMVPRLGDVLEHLGQGSRVMDGMHRVARALMEGRAEIDAVRFRSPLEPDYRSCQPHELQY